MPPLTYTIDQPVGTEEELPILPPRYTMTPRVYSTEEPGRLGGLLGGGISGFTLGAARPFVQRNTSALGEVAGGVAGWTVLLPVARRIAGKVLLRLAPRLAAGAEAGPVGSILTGLLLSVPDIVGLIGDAVRRHGPVDWPQATEAAVVGAALPYAGRALRSPRLARMWGARGLKAAGRFLSGGMEAEIPGGATRVPRPAAPESIPAAVREAEMPVQERPRWGVRSTPEGGTPGFRVRYPAPSYRPSRAQPFGAVPERPGMYGPERVVSPESIQEALQFGPGGLPAPMIERAPAAGAPRVRARARAVREKRLQKMSPTLQSVIGPSEQAKFDQSVEATGDITTALGDAMQRAAAAGFSPTHMARLLVESAAPGTRRQATAALLGLYLNAQRDPALKVLFERLGIRSQEQWRAALNRVR